MEYPIAGSDSNRSSKPDLNSNDEVSITFSLVSDGTRKAVLIMNSIMTLMVLLTYGSIILRHPMHYSVYTLALAFLPILFLFCIQWFVFRRKEGTVRLNADGLEFIGVSPLTLLKRGKRTWSDVHSVQITYPQSMGRNSFPHFKGQPVSFWHSLGFNNYGPDVTFDFKSGGSATVELPYLTKPQAEEFLGAIEKFGEPSRFTSHFVKMQRAIVLERLDSQSFTQLWSESISPRYCATTYVPLSTNHELQNGRYTVLMELAAGGMSAVYLAKGDGVKVILKESVLPSDIGESQKEKARELFEREAKLLLKLSHPQIAKVLDRFVEATRDYLVIEYVPGLTLGQLVKAKGRQKEKDVLKWCRQLAEILAYLHGQEPPLLHRDLTPDNIILKSDGTVFLIDFGAANEFVGQATGTMIGKQCYIAPEQLRGKASQASDLYALGATLNYLLTGEDPEPLSVSVPKLKHSQISQACSDLVSNLTAYESSERPASASEVLNLLVRLDTDSGIAKSGKT